jgi:hypothetical protein
MSAGLEVQWVRMFKGGVEGRFVMGTAKPAGWLHESPAVELHGFVDATGRIGPIEIRCAASDEDHFADAFVAPALRSCRCDLECLPETLQAVWAERQVIIDQGKSGQSIRRFVGQWLWEAPEDSLSGS